MSDDSIANELRELPLDKRYARLKELMPPSFKIGDISRLKKRLAALGVEVPWS